MPLPTQHLALVSLLVRDYDEAIGFYVGTLGFTLVEDTHQPEQDKRWVVVAPPDGRDSHDAPATPTARGCGLLLARASTEEQRAHVGNQTGGRVFLFLHTDDITRDHARYLERGVRFVRPPAAMPYGTVAVFEDLYGNLWDLIEPAPIVNKE